MTVSKQKVFWAKIIDFLPATVKQIGRKWKLESPSDHVCPSSSRTAKVADAASGGAGTE